MSIKTKEKNNKYIYCDDCDKKLAEDDWANENRAKYRSINRGEHRCQTCEEARKERYCADRRRVIY